MEHESYNIHFYREAVDVSKQIFRLILGSKKPEYVIFYWYSSL